MQLNRNHGCQNLTLSPLSRRFPAKTRSPSVRPYATYKRFKNDNSSFNTIDIINSKYTKIFVAGSVIFYLYNLDSAPFTGRTRLLWIPYWMEAKIGDYSYSQLLQQYRKRILPASDPHYAQISKVMNRLLASAIDGTSDPKQKEHLRKLDWKIHIINTQNALQDPPNAFILLNGKIFIFSSILPICHNEDGLATVLAHELSHQLAHHSLEQLSKQPIYIIMSSLLYAATGISGFNDLLIAGLFQMPASREMESEADRIGCELMARLCFNYNEAVNFWMRMDRFEQQLKQNSFNMSVGMVLDFFATHPNTKKRIQDIKLWLPELATIQEASDCHQYGMFRDFSRNFFHV